MRSNQLVILPCLMYLTNLFCSWCRCNGRWTCWTGTLIGATSRWRAPPTPTRFSVQNDQRGKTGISSIKNNRPRAAPGQEMKSRCRKVLISGLRFTGSRISRLFFSNLTLFYFPSRRHAVAVRDSRKDLPMTQNTNRKSPTNSKPTSLSRRQRSAARQKLLKDTARTRNDQREVKLEFLPESCDGRVSVENLVFSMINWFFLFDFELLGKPFLSWEEGNVRGSCFLNNIQQCNWRS